MYMDHVAGRINPRQVRLAMLVDPGPVSQRRKLYPEWRQKKRTPPQRDNRQYIEGLTKAGIDPFEVNRSDEGLWIFFQK